MIINAKRKELLAQARKVSRAVNYAHTVKEIKGILFEADEKTGLITMTSTNYEVSIRSILLTAVEKSGNAIIDARLVLGILDLLAGENVYMELKDNGHLYITDGKTNYSIAVMPGKTFPKVEIPFPDDTITVKGLKTLINQSVFAASENTGKAVNACVNLTFSESGVRAAAIDGNCAVQVKGDSECKGNISLLIPASSLKLLASATENNDVYELGVTGNHGISKNVVFSDGVTSISIKLIQGTFADTDKLFAANNSGFKTIVKAETLYNLLTNVSSIASRKDCVEFSFADGELIIGFQNETGSSSFRLDVKEINGTEEKYYYLLPKLMMCLREMKGDAELLFNANGTLVIQNNNIRFIAVRSRPRLIEPVKEKDEEVKKPKKKKAA